MKTTIKIITIFCWLVGIVQLVQSATITSANSGNWNSGTSWVGGIVPIVSDHVIISNGHIVNLTGNASITNFILNSGGSLNDGGFNLTVSGNLIINGSYNGSGTGRILLTGIGASMDGNGTINNVNRIVMGAGISINILATANLTFTGVNQKIDIKANNTTTNNGTITLKSVTGANNINSKWINATNAVLNISEDLLSTGLLIATAQGNTINYNGANNQTIYTTIYHNLILSNASSKSATGALTINGNFTMAGNTTFNAGASLTHTFLGNWFINSAAVNPFLFTTASTVNFNLPPTPSSTQINGTSVAAIGFNNVTLNNTSGFSSNLNFNVSGVLTISLNVTFTPAPSVVINNSAIQGTITGNGTVRVTRIAVTAGYLNQYRFTTHTLGGLTVDYAGTSAQTANALIYGNLKISNSNASVVTEGNITVNNVLTLDGNLPNGDLDMGASTLTMGGSASTAGVGDVIGIVKRVSINPNTEYSFGNQLSTITFPAMGTLPSEMSVKISIGVSPPWKSDALKRFYDIIQTGGSGSILTLKLH